MWRGRNGPSKTPGNVVCQKCLKRDKSYNGLASPQDRPYVSRPSRTQQLKNPKLVPKLTNEVPDALQKKVGIADEELAKREAERAGKYELGDRHVLEPAAPVSHRRDRSRSYDSVSTVSTRSPLSPQPARRAARSPVRERSPRVSPLLRRRRSIHSSAGDSREQSPAPDRRRRSESAERSHFASERRPRGRRESAASSQSAQLQRHDSRSPESRSRRRGHEDRRAYRDRRDRSRDFVSRQRSPSPPKEQPPARSPDRQRSLSPFSKRLALTQAMNMGG